MKGIGNNYQFPQFMPESAGLRKTSNMGNLLSIVLSHVDATLVKVREIVHDFELMYINTFDIMSAG